MKGVLNRTKVVVRHLPPTICESNFVEHIDSCFSGRYHWFAFCSGKSSQKHLKFSRAYISFNKHEDVIEFAAFFSGHAFVNERGAQFKTIVEYAPSQRVPKQCFKKDGREGTIDKDLEYLNFLEFLAKPVESLPSAEIQLERKETERAGVSKDVPIVTPLMQFVRQKRAAKRNAANVKLRRRVNRLSSKAVASSSSKRGSERTSGTLQYELRDNSNSLNINEKSKEDQSPIDKTTNSAVPENEALDGETGGSVPARFGKKKFLLLKGKEMEIPQVSGASLRQHNTTSLLKVSHGSSPSKQSQPHEAGRRAIRNIPHKMETNQDRPSLSPQSEQELPVSNKYIGKRSLHHLLPVPKGSNGAFSEKVVNEMPTSSEKYDRRTRNKGRPDRVVWTPHRLSDGSHAIDESSSSSFRKPQVGDSKEGSFRHGDHHGSAYNAKDAEGIAVTEGRPSKKGVSGYGSHEKQVWIQKSSSDT